MPKSTNDDVLGISKGKCAISAEVGKNGERYAADTPADDVPFPAAISTL